VKTANILIVEDEFIVARDIQDRLRILGYSVAGLASNGSAAIDLAGSHRPDLVLMDIRLQGDMDGIAAADEIRRRFRLPVIFLTAYAEDDTLQRAKTAEPFGFILKPFEDRELRSTIEIALFKHHAEMRIAQLSQLYQILADTNEAIVRIANEGELFRRVCDLTLQLDGCRLVWIGLRDAERNTLVPKASAGELATALHGLELPLDSSMPAGTILACDTFRQGKVLIRNDYPSDAERTYWRQQPATEDVSSAMCLPLRRRGEVVGILTIGAKEPKFFDAEIMRLFKEMAMDISFGLDNMLQARELRETLAALRNSELKLRTMLNTPFLFSGLLDQAGRMLQLNTTILAVIGRPETELLGLPFWESPWFVHDARQRERVKEAVTKAARDESSRFELTYVVTDGTIRQADFSLLPVKDTQQHVVWLVAQATDITERKQSEEMLQHQANELKARNEELERFNRVVVGRELRMIELKMEINDLSRRLNQPPPYRINIAEAEGSMESTASPSSEETTQQEKKAPSETNSQCEN
jgi:PAS domain S-box-containing protein